MMNISLGTVQDDAYLSGTGVLKEVFSEINVTDTIRGNDTSDFNDGCLNISLNDFSLLPTIAFIILAAVGIFLCTVGYRFIRTSVFIISVTLTSSLVYVVCNEVVASNLPVLVMAGSSLLSGMLAGLVSLLLLSCFGSRLVCCGAGFILATYLLVLLRILFHFPMPVARSLRESLGYHGDLESLDDANKSVGDVYLGNGLATQNDFDLSKIFPVIFTLIMLAFCGCVTLVTSFLRPKVAMVLSTAAIGSAMLGVAGDFFTDRGAIVTRISLDCLAIKSSLVSHLCHMDQCCCCWSSWLLLALVPTLIVASMLLQWYCSAAGFEHTMDKMGLVSCGTSSSGCGAGRQTGVPVLMEPSEKYRHLYRIRRTNGDIISRTHMEAIEVRKSNPSLMLTNARSSSDVVTTTDDDATLVLTHTLDE